MKRTIAQAALSIVKRKNVRITSEEFEQFKKERMDEGFSKIGNEAVKEVYSKDTKVSVVDGSITFSNKRTEQIMQIPPNPMIFCDICGTHYIPSATYNFKCPNCNKHTPE